MNIEIQPVIVPTKGTGTQFFLQSGNFPMFPTNVSFYWQVQTTEGTTVLDGNLYMDEQTYNGWSNDDNYAIDWALNELGLQRLVQL
jgi:hypothetical protein